jgi:glycine/D-amino acid oxidase-like deaminating enzyme
MPGIVIIGGGLHGCSAAYHLLLREPGLSVTVVERDPTYDRAASARSHAGLRLLWSQEENLRMSQYGQEFYRNFSKLCAVDGEPAHLDFWQQGYLFIANTPEQAEAMEGNFAFQQRMGVNTQLLDGAALKTLYPVLNTEDIIWGNYGPDDGWIDPYGALTGLRRKVRSMGATFVAGEVTGLQVTGGLVRGVELADGGTLPADTVVNNAGAWAHEICAMLDFDIPVRPLHRTTFYFEPETPQPKLPQTLDGQPAAFRQQGEGFLTGLTQFEMTGAFHWEPKHDLFEDTIWPRIAHRNPAFETIKLKNAWACHYAQNQFDGNMLIGNWPGQPENFLMATGFSGHGLQHAPATGRAMAELILDGRFESIDLDRFHARRVSEGRPEPEQGTKA